MPLLFIVLIVVGAVLANQVRKARAINKYYWRVLYLLDQDDRMMPPEHIANKLGLDWWTVHTVVNRLDEDDCLYSGHHGSQRLVRINYTGKELIRENHEILVGQPWYHGPL